MCGIAGFSLSPLDSRRVDALSLSRSLLVAIERRGPHASGAAWTEADGEAYWHKAGLPARKYVGTLPMPPTAQVAILHTRYATQGNPAVNENNHPFSLPGITGIHNGVVRNDEAIFDRLGVERTCETDSEAIFALLAHDDRPAWESLGDVDADAALAWIETDRPRSLQLARLDGRPLALAETTGGSIVFASTLPLLRLGVAGHGLTLRRTWEVPPYRYLRFWQGNAQASERILPAVEVSRARQERAADAVADRWRKRLPAGSAADHLIEQQRLRIEAADRVDPRLRLGGVS